MTTTADLSRCLYVQEGVLRLDIPDGVLPAFVIEAFNLACTGQIDRSQALLTETDLAQVDRMIRQRRPGADVVSLVLAMTYQRIGLLKTAGRWYEQVASLCEHPLVYHELGRVYRDLMWYGQAARCEGRALELAPNDEIIRAAYVDSLMGAGRVDEATDLMAARVQAGQADAHEHSCLLFARHYQPQVDRVGLYRALCDWGARHTPLSRARGHHARDLDPDRPLRIGYLSADWRDHSVAHTFEPLLDALDGGRLQIYGYGSVARPDAVTERLAAKFTVYRDILRLDDPAAADLIDRDRVDILVTLAGHTAGHRLQVLACRPAPIQVDMGSISTLGMAQVDYRLTDAVLDPPSSQAFYLEHLVHVPSGYVCYRPPDDAPAVGSLPAARRGVVTFAAMNHRLKMNPYVIALWAAVLHRVPDSRLVMKFPGGEDPLVTEPLLDQFDRAGIARQRLQVLGPARAKQDHWRLLNEVDIALDSYPFNGCVTTLDGLWMGVPTITLAGDTYISHVGHTILTRVGLDVLVAGNPDEYVAKAVALAGRPEALATLRSGLRSHLKASPLCDGRRYVQEMETIFRWMWKRYVRATPGPIPVQSDAGPGRGSEPVPVQRA